MPNTRREKELQQKKKLQQRGLRSDSDLLTTIEELRRKISFLEECLCCNSAVDEKVQTNGEGEKGVADEPEFGMNYVDTEGVVEALSGEVTGFMCGHMSLYAKKSRYEKIVRIVTESVHKSIELEEVIENAVDAMSKHIETAQNVSIFMVEGDEAVLRAYRGYPEQVMKELARIPYPKGFTWKTIVDSAPLYCPDVDKDNVIGQQGRKLGTKSYVSMPICYAGKAIGCLNINSLEKYSFDQEELNLLESVAKQIESAINNARRAESLDKSRKALRESVAKLRAKNRFEKVISSVTRSFHRSLDLDEVFENAVEAMYEEVKEVECVMIYMVEDVRAEKNNLFAVMKAQRGHGQEFIEKVTKIPYPKGNTWKTMIGGKSRYITDVDRDRSLGQAGRDYGIKSYISMPLKLEDDTVGCIHIHSFKKSAFGKDLVKLLEIVARQLETAINNAKKTEALRSSEEALRKVRDELEDRVSDRTSELQKANTLLIKEILERRCVENELKQSLDEKDVLLKEIHHRVKNNLQIISSLLSLQSRKLKDKKVLSSLIESNNRIRSIATLHEQLYRSKDLSMIDFSAHIRNMASHLLRSYGKGGGSIKVVIDSEQIYLDINTAIPCGLIVNELVSNAIKHGFAGSTRGEIVIEFKKAENKYLLRVSNDGLKFPEDLDINNSDTLGLELVSSLSKQLKGAITMSSEDVTEFRLEFES